MANAPITGSSRSAWLKAPQAKASTTTNVRIASRPRNRS